MIARSHSPGQLRSAGVLPAQLRVGRLDICHCPDEYIDEDAMCRCAAVYALYVCEAAGSRDDSHVGWAVGLSEAEMVSVWVDERCECAPRLRRGGAEEADAVFGQRLVVRLEVLAVEHQPAQ